ncbi:hypothetical protein M432DRAFT_38698 [Thermoascus aurantiacus ATCC 26904]
MEPFPQVEHDAPQPPQTQTPSSLSSPPPQPQPSRWLSQASRSFTAPAAAASGRLLRSASLKFLESNPPNGMWHATGEIASRAPTIDEIRRGSFTADGWTEEGQMEQRGNSPLDIHRRRLSRTSSYARRAAARRHSAVPSTATRLVIPETVSPRVSESHERGLGEEHRVKDEVPVQTEDLRQTEELIQHEKEPSQIGPDETGTYPNGYRFPPKHTLKESIMIGLKAFLRFVLTPFGFLVIIYSLNIVGWGAMIFFLLINAAPAMCHPSCDSDDSPRKKWIEIDSQVLNALFCVTGLGLIPWRFRDLYWLIRWRVFKDHDALRRLAGIHRTWYRLPGSDTVPEDIGPPPPPSSSSSSSSSSRTEENNPLYTAEDLNGLRQNPALPLPPTSIPPAPLTGVRSPPTRPQWLLDLVVWLYVWNTLFQICLCGLMWGMNRFTRPAWAVGLLISLGCLSGMVAGVVVFVQSKAIKKVEGIPVEEGEEEASSDDDDVENGKGNENGSEGPKPGRKSLLLKKTRRRRGSQWFQRH